MEPTICWRTVQVWVPPGNGFSCRRTERLLLSASSSVVASVEWTTLISSEPKATFNVYGNDNELNVRDVLLQNLVAVDGQKGPTTGDVTYGAYYFPEESGQRDDSGSIALNVEAEYAGFFIKELQGQNIKMIDSIAWGSYGPSAWWPGSQSGVSPLTPLRSTTT